MSIATFTFDVDGALLEKFSAAANERGCTADELLRDLMRELVHQQHDPEYNAWFREQVQAGLDDIASGNVVSDEEVQAEIAAMREDALRRLASSKS